MLTGSQLWDLIQHIIPVYVIVFLGWFIFKFKFLLPVHAPGIGRFVTLCAVPSYVFHLLAFNDPYKINLRLVGADILQKVVALTIGTLYWVFAKNSRIEDMINFFMLATLPNTVLIGDALLEPLYDDVHGRVVTIIFLQALLWYNLTIALYEMRIVLLEIQAEEGEDADAELQRQREQPVNSSHKSGTFSLVENFDDGKARDQRFANLPAALPRTLSAPPLISRLTDIVTIRLSISKDEDTSVEDFPGSQDVQDSKPDKPFSPISGEPPKGTDPKVEAGHEQGVRDTESDHFVIGRVVDPEAGRQPRKRRMTALLFSSLVAYKVFNRLKYVPLTFASITGFAYSMFAYKYNWTMPYYVRTSVELISNSAIGMAVFLLGITVAMSGKLIACGWKKTTYGMVIRFVVGPFIMIVASLAFRLKGNNYRFAVLQAVIPQGVISFVLATEYNVSVNEFSTAVITQLIVFIPVILIYYVVLDVV